jgi:fluoride exporter
MHPLFPVMAGGAVGAALRYMVGTALNLRAGEGWPWGTFSVNIVGGFAMGILAALMLRGSASDMLRLFIGVGLLGGFTTFSAFSLEGYQMVQRGQFGLLSAYVLASVLGSIAALAAGFALVRA